MCNHLNLPISNLADLNDIAQVPHSVVDFDLVVKELFEGGDIEDLVRGGLRSVDYELEDTWHFSYLLGPNDARNARRKYRPSS